jgi:hypothetical protein
MRNLRTLIYISIFLTGMVLLNSCHKHHSEPLIINPTVNPIPYSVLVYLITPTDQKFTPQYYTAVKTCALNLQNWYKLQMGDKTFIMNPVVVDTLTGLHNSSWYHSNNGPAISGSGTICAYYNTVYEMRQLLGANFDTTHYTYFVYVASDFPDETKPRGLAAEGLGNITGLCGKSPNSFTGDAGHALGHAFGLPEYDPGSENSQAIMSTGYPFYPDCILQQPEKDSLNASPFFEVR